jgi:hypothetical protein
MAKVFMKDPATKKHRKRIDEQLYVHYPSTCTIINTRHRSAITSKHEPFAKRKTAIETRLASSPKGLVAICYETKGLITFFAQITPTYTAWQRIEWPVDFHKNWDETKVKKAIENFLWVAECEVKRQYLPKP